MPSATTNSYSVRSVAGLGTLLVVLAAVSWIVSHHSHGGIKGVAIPIGHIISCFIFSAAAALICKLCWRGIAVPFIAGIAGVFGIAGQFYGPYGGVLGLLVGCGVLSDTGRHDTQLNPRRRRIEGRQHAIARLKVVGNQSPVIQRQENGNDMTDKRSRALTSLALMWVGSFWGLSCWSEAEAQESRLRLNDPSPQQYRLTARASVLDRRVKAHPEIDFLIDTKDGKPADVQQASVDTRVAPRGKLAIWLMGHNEQLFDRINSYGIHAIRVHYANRWFSICCRENPVGEHCRGNIRLEAATGMDFSDDVDIPKPDGMMERAFQFVKWLAKENPQGGWEYFLTKDGQGIRWEDVIVTGSSHGSTTASRFAKFQKVSRVVAFCGPRDQLQAWQSLPSATPENRYFGFSHVLDGGWVADHYCRSWELMGLHKFGPIVNVDQSRPPYSNTRRLITDFNVNGDARRAHSSVVPGSRANKDPKTGKYLHEAVWRYLFTHPVDSIGRAVPMDDSCDKDQRS